MRIFGIGCNHCDHMIDDPYCKRNQPIDINNPRWNPSNRHAWECCKCLRIKSIG